MMKQEHQYQEQQLEYKTILKKDLYLSLIHKVKHRYKHQMKIRSLLSLKNKDIKTQQKQSG